MTAAPIRATFPQGRVGGPAVANDDGDLLPGFIDLCAKDGTWLEFVSWHFYADDPRRHSRLEDRHWNEVPRRFGLFGVGQEVRPQYFVYQQ